MTLDVLASLPGNDELRAIAERVRLVADEHGFRSHTLAIVHPGLDNNKEGTPHGQP